MPRKTTVCRCEDVTLADLEHCVTLGYGDIEQAKRYTGLGTGPCQGKECLVPACRLLTAATGRREADTVPFTTRPPLVGVSLGSLARAAELEDGGDPDE